MSAVKHLHFLAKAPFTSYQEVEVILLNRAIPLIKRHISQPKEPLRKEHLLKMADILDNQGQRGLVIKAALITGFYGFLRSSNIVPDSVQEFDFTRQFVRQDISITPSGMCIRLKWMKNMQNSIQPHIIAIPTVILMEYT